VKAGGEDTNAHELVLIRRRAGGDDAPHKGGVWKIAYADFMTAMMAFFLVMWLINSTDQRVLTQVANYFNPMRLTDSTPHSRGLNTIESGDQGKQGKQSSVGDPKDKLHANDAEQAKTDKRNTASTGEPSKASKDAGGATTAKYSEQTLFSDPYGVLARIAAEAPVEVSAAAKEGGASASGAYRDPFDPVAQRPPDDKISTETKASPAHPDNRLAQAKNGEPAKAKKADVGSANAEGAKANPTGIEGTKADGSPSATEGEAKGQTQADLRRASASAEAAKALAAAQDAAKAAEQALQKAAQDEAARIEHDIRRAAPELKGMVPNIDVTVSDEGVLISLTDDNDFGMFAIASAEPRPAMVVIMEKIARIVQGYQQPLTVRGHTDGRPYRSGTYDNWRLSTARAHMAYYMLVRGGVDEKRFDRIEGYADRRLRVPNDPEAAQNRRIEILLRRTGP
jgi:chemotaxis protein MotB